MAEPMLNVEIVEGSALWRQRDGRLAEALIAAAEEECVTGAVAVLLGDDAAVAALNQQFRGKAGATNVLSFPAGGEGEAGFLGDIALAAETIAKEAESQGKSFEAHAAHLAVHGFLHLLGYDHMAPEEAEAMEARERAILAKLGIADPYGAAPALDEIR